LPIGRQQSFGPGRRDLSLTTGAAPAAILMSISGTIRCYADSSRGRFHCLATAHPAIAAHAPAVVRPGCEAPLDHQSEHRSAGRPTSVRWSPGHGARQAENPVAALQVIPRSLLVQPARRLPGPFTVNAAVAARSRTSGLRHRVPTFSALLLQARRAGQEGTREGTAQRAPSWHGRCLHPDQSGARPRHSACEQGWIHGPSPIAPRCR
jgi:hypothetical protein